MTSEAGEPSAANPEQFGKYMIERKIGVGGMAEIYLATLNSDRKKRFAIKKLLSHYSNNSNLISMLVNEAKVSVSLQHPNVVPIYDFGRVEDTYYLALEYVDGKDLKSLIHACRRAGKAIPLSVALFITMEVLEGLAYAHKKRDNFNRTLDLVHRDISPQNIMISELGEVKILDFGIAKVRGKASETQTGVLKGKFSYMAPEQARGIKIDRRTDLFSVGILLYEMLTLESPFMAENEVETLQNVRKSKYRSPRLYNPGIPKSLEKIIKTSLKRMPQVRYQWAEDFQRELFNMQQREKIGIATPSDVRRFFREVRKDEKGVQPTKTEAVGETTHVDDITGQHRYEFARLENATDAYRVWTEQRHRHFKWTAVLAVWAVGMYFFTKYYDVSRLYERLLAKKQPVINALRLQQLTEKPEEPAVVKVTPPAPVVPTTNVETAVVPAVPVAITNVQFKGKAANYLEQLPFTQFEKLRDQVEDALLVRFKEGVSTDKPASLQKLKLTGVDVHYRFNLAEHAIDVEELLPLKH